MAAIDATAVNVTLPVLQTEFGASVTQVQWIIEAYALFLAALLLVGGSFGDVLGRRRTFAFGTAGFAVASALCGIAPTIETLIAARAFQGIAAALMVPGSLAIISSAFPPESRGKAIGTWAGLGSVPLAAGPVIGGWLTTEFSWRWVFFMNIPLAAAVLVLLFLYVHESKRDGGPRLDWVGALVSVAGLGALTYGLIEAANLGFFHPLVISAVVGGLVLLAVFLVWEDRFSDPLVPPGIFRSKSFTGANLLTFMLYAALGIALFFVPFNLIQVQGFSATAAGAAWLPLILLLAVMSRWAGGLIPKYGARLPLVAGPALTGLGFFLLVVPGVGANYWLTFFPATIVLGIGMAITVAPLVTVVTTSVDESYLGTASGVNNAVSRVGPLIAIAVVGVVALGLFNASLDSQLESIDAPSTVLELLDGERIKLAGAEVPIEAGTETGPLIKTAINEAFVFAFRIIMLTGGVLAIASAMIAAFTIESRRKSSGASAGRLGDRVPD